MPIRLMVTPENRSYFSSNSGPTPTARVIFKASPTAGFAAAPRESHVRPTALPPINCMSRLRVWGIPGRRTKGAKGGVFGSFAPAFKPLAMVARASCGVSPMFAAIPDSFSSAQVRSRVPEPTY
jgi:hypothetical protein